MSEVIRALAVLARSFESGMPYAPSHAMLGITPDAARELAAAARVEYDAALARAEAAETELAFARSQAQDGDNAWGCEKQKRVSAESRLAEATALLTAVREHAQLWANSDSPTVQRYGDTILEALSATPAQAAEPGRECCGQLDTALARIAELEAEQRLRRAEVVLLSGRIAQAVAALEKAREAQRQCIGPMQRLHINEALEALR